MIDQTRGGETRLILDPHEIHGRRAPTRRPARPARRSRVRVAGGAMLCLVAVAGISWATLSFMAAEPGRPRRGGMVTGSVDYPDLKDGVPALVAPRGQVRVVGVPSSASPAQEVAAMTASPVDSSAMASLAGGGTLPRPTIAPTGTPVQAAVRPVPVATQPQVPPRADTPRSASAPASASAPISVSAPATVAPTTVASVAPSIPAATAPLPTPRPAAVTPTRSAARPETRPADQPRGGAQAVTLPPQRASATRLGARTEPMPEAPAIEDDHINVFGLAVPTIGATGRRIREGVEALGDAVGRL